MGRSKMIRFQLIDGTYKNVKPEHLDIFKERYPAAVEVSGEPGLSPEGFEITPLTRDVLGKYKDPNAPNPWKSFKVILGLDKYEEPEIEEEDKKQPSYFGIKESLSVTMGDNIITDFLAEEMSEMYRMGVGGVTQAGMTQPAWDIMSHLEESTPEEINAIYEAHLASQAVGQTDAVKKYNARYEQLKKDYGGIMAFVIGVAENPEYIRDVSIQSLGNMITSAVTSEDVAGRAIAAGGTMAAVGSVVPLLGTSLGFISGAMGAVSGTMDAGQSFSQFLQEQLELEGKDFTPENIQKFLQNDEVITFKDPHTSALDITGTRAEIIKQRAIRRGISIGVVDGLTAVVAGGVAKGGVGKKLTTKRVRGAKGTAWAVGGGIASEVAGQTFGGQEYEAGEILTEGFAEKGMVMTGVTVLPQMLKKKGTYKIGKQEFSEAAFVKEVNAMNDMTLAMADVTVENDAALNRQLGLRQQDAIVNSQIDPNIKDPKDRKTLVEKQKELDKAEADARKKGSYAVPGAQDKVETIQAEIDAIVNKYSGIDTTTHFMKKLNNFELKYIYKKRKNLLKFLASKLVSIHTKLLILMKIM